MGQLEEFPSYNYFDKIAVEWQRNSITTIDEAIDLIKKRLMKRESKKPVSKRKNELPNDIESDWFDEYMKNR